MKRILTTIALFVSIGLIAAGCGSSSNQGAGSTGNEQAGGQPAGQAAGQAGGGAPAGSGKVTDVSGSTAQVQGQQSQVAVTWTGSTAFTKDVTTDASAVKVGSCVTAFATPTSGSSTTTDSVAAATVRITAATNGSCTIQRGAGGSGPGGAGTPPSGAPEGGTQQRPSGRPSNGTGRGFGAIGKVTKVTASGFTVASQQRGSSTSKTTTVTVTTSGKTVFSTTAKASATDVKVGVCVTSRGKADDTGAITATTIAVSQPVNDECGFGGFGARPQS